MGALLIVMLGGGYILYKLCAEDSSGATSKALQLSGGIALVFLIAGAIADACLEMDDIVGFIVVWSMVAIGVIAATVYFAYYLPKYGTKQEREAKKARDERVARCIERNKREYDMVEAKLASGITKEELMRYMIDWQVITRVTRENIVDFLELCKEFKVQRGDMQIDPKSDAAYYIGGKKSVIFYITSYTFLSVNSIRSAATVDEIWMDNYKTCNVCDYEYVLHPEKYPEIAMPGTAINLDDM